MKNISKYINQNHELLELTEKISKTLNATSLRNDPSEIKKFIAHLAGRINVHLTMEDKNLYPRLLKSNNKKIIAIVEKYIQEMGHLHNDFIKYYYTWNDEITIKNNPLMFIRDTNALIKKINRRLIRENNELFPMVQEKYEQRIPRKLPQVSVNWLNTSIH